MDFKIWNETILSWVNSLGLSCNINRFEQVKQNDIEEIIKIVEAGSEKSIINFINETFPNFNLSDTLLDTPTDKDYLIICTLILIYVCFTNKDGLDTIKQKMCSKLENSVQENITAFLINLQKHGDVFALNKKTIFEEIMKFSQRCPVPNSASGDGTRTPVKALNTPVKCESPLLEFLQTPKRKSDSKPKNTSSSYNNSDQLKKIKELTDQLVEEELEKATLQERLMWHEMKCNDYENKLKNKIKELEQMKSEWQKEVSSNENQIDKYRKIIDENAEEKAKLCKELNYFESYAGSLEKELSTVTCEKKTLEEQLKYSLSKVDEYNEEIISLSKANAELEAMIKAKEQDLQMLKENIFTTSQNESFFEPNMDDSLDCLESGPENMGVVIEKLLKERTSENETLREAIDAMKSDKECLTNEIGVLRSQLSAKTSQNAQLQQLNKQLLCKIEGFVKTCKDIQILQKKLLDLSKDLDGNNSCGLSLFRKTDAMNVFEMANLTNLLDSEEPVVVTLFNESDSKELHVIYDSSKELTDSASQFSLDDNDTTHLTTIMESLNESEDASTRSDSTVTNEPDKTSENFEMEELNQEIITAKKSLIAFLRASIKNFEVLKIKETLVHEMSKQHENLQSRITSLTELNTRLTKEIVNSKNISQVDSEHKERELDNLKTEVESLKKASNILKEKLAMLEKTNETLVNKKEECLSELALLREQNKTLNNDLQNKVMTQLKQQSSCLGLIRTKQESGLELERTLKIKDDIDKRFTELRKLTANSGNKIPLEIMLNSAEQKFFVTCQNLLHVTYSCLKWSAKSMEHQYFLIGQGDILPDNHISEDLLKKEHEENQETLRNITNLLNRISEELDAVEAKCNDNLSDSLEIISANNKTFDIINLEEKDINEKTFSVGTEDAKITTGKNSNAAWLISPPAKAVRTTESKAAKKDKPSQSKSWVIPFTPPEKGSQTYILTNEESLLLRSKSSYASAIQDIESKTKCKKSNSVTSFASATGSVVSSGTSEEPKSSSKGISSVVEVPNELKEKISNYIKECDMDSECSLDMWRRLKNKVSQLQKELAETMEENNRLRTRLADCEDKRKQEKENFDKRQKTLRENIASEYENQLENLKTEMKALYNRELAKHKTEQSKVNFELREQNKIYKDHVDDLRSQLWTLGEKLLQEQKIKRDLERNLEEMKKKFSRISCLTELESKCSQDSDVSGKKQRIFEENYQACLKQFRESSYPLVPNEDEGEVFDNRCLEDMKAGICKVEGPEGRLTELQYRNSLCLPHLKSSYPVETQFHNPRLYRENELKYGVLNFGQESQSLTDSDHSMTRSLLPQDHQKKKEQTSYKKPGPPTPSKNGGRLSIIQNEVHGTPRKVLRESNGSLSERRSTPGRIKSLFSTKSAKREGGDQKDENTVPVTSRGKKLKIFPSVKPFGARDY